MGTGSNGGRGAAYCNDPVTSRGASHGGGGPSGNNGNCAASGGVGAVRIMWGLDRVFPNNAYYTD